MYLSFVGKLAGLFTAIDILPPGGARTGLIIFDLASVVEDAANRFGDMRGIGYPGCGV